MGIADDFARALDPVEIFRQGVRDTDNRKCEPDSWQRDIMRSESPRELILCSRQAGKSTTVGAKAAHGLIYNPGLVLIIAPTLRQSKLLFSKVRDVYKALSDAPTITVENQTELSLSNGSTLVALPGDSDATLRGYSAPRMVLIDEAARVHDHVYAALRPMLAVSNGSLIALTTPYGRRGWFYEAWEFGKGWARTTITARDCPRITDEYLATEREAMSEWQFRQEFLCEFVDTEESFFNSELVDRMVDRELEAWI